MGSAHHSFRGDAFLFQNIPNKGKCEISIGLIGLIGWTALTFREITTNGNGNGK